jgi:aldehyde:ferredoxin oxidoreductase
VGWPANTWSARSIPKVDPLSPENKLIYATGPLTGTMASTGGRYSVITKGPLTGVIACSNSGGYFGAELKSAGWDMLIFEGRSPQPVYLHIENEKATLLPAGRSVGPDRMGHRRRPSRSVIRIRCCGYRALAAPGKTRSCLRRS